VLEQLLSWLDAMGSAIHHPAVLGLLTLAPVLEYVFPPFPGDTISLFGAILVSAYGWNLGLVFGLLMCGSLIGSYLAFTIGRRWRQRRAPNVAEASKLSALVEGFQRHGTYYLLLNRFLPGIRPIFFVAAGLSKMSTARVMFMSGISALLWNAMLMFAGVSIGNNLSELQSWLSTYSTVAYTVMAVLVLGLTGRFLWNRR
jgi:membrane protein DedA with SNARE-associated domain